MNIPRLLALCLFAIPLFSQAAPGVTLAPFTFNTPEGWLDVPVTSPMRKAHWQIKEGAAVADVAFFQFGKGQGGSVDENIQRWLSQFSESAAKGEAAKIEVAGTTIHFIRSEGIFSSGMPGGPTTPLPNQALRGAILETSEGLIFVKMTGPKPLVEAQEKAFTDLVTAAARGK